MPLEPIISATAEDISNIAYAIVSTAPQVAIRREPPIEVRVAEIESKTESEEDIARLMYDTQTLHKLRNFVFPIHILDERMSDLTIKEYAELRGKKTF